MGDLLKFGEFGRVRLFERNCPDPEIHHGLRAEVSAPAGAVMTPVSYPNKSPPIVATRQMGIRYAGLTLAAPDGP